MSTRCLIGILYPNDEYKYSYCHFDGYPEGVGVTLRDHYTNNDIINRLLNGGDFSSLEDEIEEIEYYEDSVNPSICSLFKIPNRGEEYIYIWNGEKWICKEVSDFREDFFNIEDLEEIEI